MAVEVEARHGQFTGWLLKKKSGTAMLRVRQYNKRFFVLDFDNRVFSYAHTEKSKKACEIMFMDIVDVRHGDGHVGHEMSDNVSECSKTSRTSFIRRMSSFTKKDDEHDPHCCLTVMVRPARGMELVCSTPGEAEGWLQAFRSAIDLGGGIASHVAGEGIDGADSSPGSQPNDASPMPAHGVGRGRSRGSSDGPYPPRPAVDGGTGGYPAVASAVAVAASDAGGDTSGQTSEIAASAVPPPKPATKGFLDFAAIEEEPSEAARGEDVVAEDAVLEATVVEETKLQASDFGFGVDDEIASSGVSSSSSAAGADPDTGTAAAEGRTSQQVPHKDSDSESEGGKERAPKCDTNKAGDLGISYQDKSEGLTLQQRLENLEFSDAEDDYDDPLGLKSKS